MSQNKTIIPGQRINRDVPNAYESAGENGIPDDFYRQSSSQATNPHYHNRTVLVDANDTTTVPQQPAFSTMLQTPRQVDSKTESQPLEEKVETPLPEQPGIPLQDRPIVGLLFSVSKTAFGEMFPVYLGRNVIGQDSDCDICLQEATVSSHHAVIVVRNLVQPVKRQMVTITDTNSMCGTLLNGVETDYDTHPLSSYDHIAIGLAYELVYIKLDPTELGIATTTQFQPSENTSSQVSGQADIYSPSTKSQSNRTIISNFNK